MAKRKMTESQLANLRPVTNSADAKRLGRNGGKKGAETKRRRMAIREWFSVIKDEPMPDSKCDELGLEHGTTYGEGMALSVIDGTLKGNPQQARLAFEMLGENKQELNINGALPVVIHDDI